MTHLKVSCKSHLCKSLAQFPHDTKASRSTKVAGLKWCSFMGATLLWM